MSDGLRTIRFLGVPTEPFLRTQLHIDELLHELELVQAGTDAGVAAAPTGLRELIDEILGDYAEARRTAWDQAELARAHDKARFDLELTLPPSASTTATRLLALLEQADEYCRAQRLLTVEAPPEVTSLRRWMTEEMVAQLERGAPATPCPL